MKSKRLLGMAAVLAAWLCGAQTQQPVTAPAALAAKATMMRFYSAQSPAPEHLKRLGENPGVVSFGSSISLQLLVEFSGPVAAVKSGKVTAFTDDQGTDLAKGAAVELVNLSDDREGTTLSPDNRAVVVSAHSDVRPALGARRVTVKGSLRVQCDSGTDVIVVKDVPLQFGAKITAGNVVLHIQGLSQGPSYTGITLRTAAGDAIQGVEFLDAQGKPFHQGYHLQRGAITLADKSVEQSFAYSLDTPLHEAATLRITLYKDARILDVPFEATAGIGM